MYNHKNKKGFTLIELLVVISIISLLTSISLSFLGESNQKGRDTGKIRAMQEVRSALQLYATEKGYYSIRTGPPGTRGMFFLTSGGYIKSIHKNLFYSPLNADGTLCIVNPCYSYLLAVPLERADNKVLTVDKDINVIPNGSYTGIQGKLDNCTSGLGSSPNDLCYDITP
jgi:prepilin-type N-terminal cleavage/methylation domain-containing protein